MEGAELPREVQALLRDRIESYEELELLVLLVREQAREWGDDELESRLGIPRASLDPAVTKLCAGDLVHCEGAALSRRSRFAPRSPQLRAAAEALVAVYQSHRLEIVKLMNALAIERMRTGALRAFADAFVLGKDKKNG